LAIKQRKITITMARDFSLLVCYAHPDDEQVVTGTMRRCLDQGMRVGLVCATRGEAGGIADPSLATHETLGSVREQELRNALRVVGVEDLYFLDYRDSGMAGSALNADPRSFINADPLEVVGRLVSVIRDFKPTVMVTFDETGGYGHPDHIAIHNWATQAFHVAADPSQFAELGPACQPARLYYASVPRSLRARLAEWAAQNNITVWLLNVPPDRFGMPDETVTHRVPVANYVQMKLDSVKQHRTQMPPDSPFVKFSDELKQTWYSTEHFAFAAGVPLPPNYDPSDLFAGLDRADL
jgi:LmbE family N-acetylglucosaminyl deacetylase